MLKKASLVLFCLFCSTPLHGVSGPLVLRACRVQSPDLADTIARKSASKKDAFLCIVWVECKKFDIEIYVDENKHQASMVSFWESKGQDYCD